VVNEGQFDRA